MLGLGECTFGGKDEIEEGGGGSHRVVDKILQPSMTTNVSDHLPECWGHRGASAEYPENTFASFEAAIAEGSDCIESGGLSFPPLSCGSIFSKKLGRSFADVHTTSDNRILMFHDTSLERTTDGKGVIAELPWEDVIRHVLEISNLESFRRLILGSVLPRNF